MFAMADGSLIEQTIHVYFIGGDRGLVKIGIAKDVRRRLHSLQIGNPAPLRLLASVAGNAALEAHYHRTFADTRVRGEWFRRSAAMTKEINRIAALRPGRHEERRWKAHVALMEEWGVIPVGAVAEILNATRPDDLGRG
ncbi:hypothetical protein DAH51_09925 [Sphingobium yanoikuyae]|jgi:hypothetical protein|uniref:Bacteriophage T5 Orf172 DNA-binding domain-containing protein n=2 Tax=Sphingobium yanoikuyae TaxID=13690 RepID=A0A430BXU6_SPHYA|nr:hypothetical protein DAH51_09925 [Sphingobium yanoikuyae]